MRGSVGLSECPRVRALWAVRQFEVGGFGIVSRVEWARAFFAWRQRVAGVSYERRAGVAFRFVFAGVQ